MKIALHWLHEYVSTPSTAAALSDKLRVATCEVESIDNWKERFQGLVVGKVLKVSTHPQADRLRVAKVSLGTSKATIVCAAPNLHEGQTVAVATPGTVIHPLKGEPVTIETTTMRGVLSEGMLCGADEIGLSLASEYHHILSLPDTLKAGLPLAEALSLDDEVLDLEITPNRPDLLSYLGIAREIAALEKRKLTEPPIASLPDRGDKELAVKVTIEDSSLCKRYSALCLENVQVKPSPLWLQGRLLLSGIRPINTVVDVGNYVMLELGHPLHAFDLAKLGGFGSAMSVKGARKGEKIITLDGVERILAHGDIVIAGKDGHATDLAGVMGGKSSAISEQTSEVLLEAAHFAGGAIRRTSRRLGLRSEASSRFEKELDPEITVTALKRAAYLLQEIAGATIRGGLVDVYPAGHTERPRIHLSFARIQQVLGASITAAESKAILQRLGFQVPSLNKSSFDTVPPSWRNDVSIPEDIIEELIRIWGFSRLPTTLPSGAPTPPQPNMAFKRKNGIRKSLAALGYHEVMHISLVSAKKLTASGFRLEECILLPNPLSEETAYLVPSHLPHFLGNIADTNQPETSIKLAEMGHVFKKPLVEQERLSLLLRSNDGESLYRQAKADCIRLFSLLGHTEATVSFKGDTITIDSQKIGTLSLVPHQIVKDFKIKRGDQLLFIEIDLPLLLSLPTAPAIYQPISNFPSSRRDITAIVDRDMPVGNIADLIAGALNTGLVASWAIGDIYTGKPLSEQSKSVTLNFIYNSISRTLTDAEVQADQNRLTKLLSTHLQAQIN